jgi:nucleotide-binding universal stress UspA family protein
VPQAIAKILEGVKMGLILCATRGGEASYKTQQAAIVLAKERDDEIVFLYIIDLSFLNKTAAPMVVDIENELEEMGRFFLLMATERATENGINARSIIRKGIVKEQIKTAIVDEGATLVVFGRPVGDKSSFHLESLEAFVAEIKEEIQVEAVIV